MAESMLGLKRSHRCTELSTENIGENVTVMGWVQKSRNKGGIIFVDLRDRSGLLQIIFEEADCGEESFAKAEKLRSEFVVAVTGKVEARSGAVNENLKTGAIEIPRQFPADSFRVRDSSIPYRGELQDKGGAEIKIPLPGFEKTRFAEKPDDQKPRDYAHQKLSGRGGILGD